MDEFELIQHYFKQHAHNANEVIVGIGDDCACLRIPPEYDCVVSTDTLIEQVHFPKTARADDIAHKAVLSNISDCVAMGAKPFAVLLSLSLPQYDEAWLSLFSQGLFSALNAHNITLAGGNTARGPLSVTLTIHGLVKKDKAILRSGAKAGDAIYLSAPLGLAALAVKNLSHPLAQDMHQQQSLNQGLYRPPSQLNYLPFLHRFASAAIDISDGLLSDLTHLCKASSLGATLDLNAIPVHELLSKLNPSEALELALNGGEDYVLCFTVSQSERASFEREMREALLRVFCIGEMRIEHGLYDTQGRLLEVKGYKHFL